MATTGAAPGRADLRPTDLPPGTGHPGLDGPPRLGADCSSSSLSAADAIAEIPDVKTALAGARDIVAELLAKNAEIRALVRKACGIALCK